MGLDIAIYDKDDRVLASKRIGNLSHVIALRNLATQMLGGESVVVSKVLYNGTHVGDSLDEHDIKTISEELEILSGAADSHMQAFVADMSEMVRTAKQHEMPIQFT